MPHKILIVDDEPFMLRLIQHHLEQAGYELIKARNGREALDIAAREVPRLVIMDAMMPNMDGFTALRQLKQDPSTRSIPVIMLTSLDDWLAGAGRSLIVTGMLTRRLVSACLICTGNASCASSLAP